MFFRNLTGVAAVVALFAAGCGEEDPGHIVAPGGSGGIIGNPGGSGGGGSGGTGGTGGTGGVDVPVCGDGVVEGDEACDDGEDNSDNAPDACRTDCTEARCGDSVEDTGETCDDGNQASGDGCSASCQLEFTCGDGLREFTEECDGEDLAGQSCADFGHNSGDLACGTDCTYDSSACATVEICDNGVDDDGDLAADCEDTDCASDIVACPTCGDGVINVDEEDCDGDELDGATCADLGFASGTLSCSGVCILDTTGCVPFEDCATAGDEDGNGLADCADPACSERFECPTCGNGIIQQGEQCEGAPPPQSNCFDNGFDTGTMSCDPVTCQISTENCRDFYCGDAAVEGPEECDDGNDVAGDGCTACMIDGDSCTNPLIVGPAMHDPVTRVWTVNASTTPMNSTYASSSCGASSGERDMVLQFTAPTTGEYALDLEFVPYQDDMLYVWKDTCGTGAEILCSDPGTGTLKLTTGQTVFIVVDGYGSSGDDDHGPFVLTITQASSCGDGIVEGSEQCDFSDVIDGDGCSATCRLEAGWACDATGCRQTTCGDGLIEGTETCEDGNTVPNDGCTNCNIDGDSCLNPLVVDSTYRDPTTGIWTVNASTTSMNATYASMTCGSSAGQRDMVLEFTAPATGAYDFDLEFVPYKDDMLYIWDGACGASTEVLCSDPGTGTLNLTAGQTIYIVVDGYGSGSATNHGPFRLIIESESCGDGFTNGAETCDLGSNTHAGCLSCQLQPGYDCDAAGCWTTVCGDGIVEGTETCDDGNTTPSDGCTNCVLDGDTCANPLVVGPQHRNPTTGIWTVSGDTTPFSKTFSASCTSSYTERDGVLSFTAPVAGTYFIDYQMNYDGVIFAFDGVCDPNAAQMACSDPEELTLTLTAGQTVFIVVDGWGSASDDDYGPFTLVIEPPIACGDGFTSAGETCDTGTTVDAGCVSCQLQPGQACDSTGCWPTVCGDGVVEGAEVCDDGNTTPGDGCTGCFLDGDSCANPLIIDSSRRDPVTGTWTVSASTTPMNSTYGSATCGSSSGERDMVMQFTAPTAGGYDLALDFIPFEDDMLYVWEGACGTGTEILCSDPGTGTLNLAAGQTIFIVVDGYGTNDDSHGPFVLTIDPPAMCGDGFVSAIETCDTGANVHAGCVSCQLQAGYACDSAGCWTTTCGDGVIEGAESCEDGNTTPNDGCTDCLIDGDSCANPLVIGSGHLDTTTGIWTIAGDTSVMSRSFTAPTCNSSNAEPEAVVKFTAPHAGEFSIDMTTVSPYDDLFYVWDSACGSGSPEIACKDTGSQTVRLDLGQDIYIVATGLGSADDDFGPFTFTVTPTAVCGNGVLEGSEACDFGDLVQGDGCSPSCRLELGWTCGATSCTPAICGDGNIEGTEQCDDLNVTPGDGCDANCMVEVVMEVEPNDTMATATPLGLTDLGTGTIRPARESDYWALSLVAGTTYTIDVSRGVDGSCGTDWYDDPAMNLYDSSGGLIEFDDDDGAGYCPQITFTPTVTGTYYAAVTSGSYLGQVPAYYIWVH